MAGAGHEARAGHALAEAALLEEICFQAAELPIKEVVGLVNQADENVGDNCGVVDDLGFGVGEEMFVAAVGRDEAAWMGRMRRMEEWSADPCRVFSNFEFRLKEAQPTKAHAVLRFWAWASEDKAAGQEMSHFKFGISDLRRAAEPRMDAN